MANRHFILQLCTGVVGLFLLTSAGLAQAIDLTWNTIDGGGGLSAGATIEVMGTIGQPDAGQMSGGAITIVGGFWGGTAVSAPCLGDVNGDRKVNLSDLAILLGNYGISSGATPSQGDLNGDGKIDLSDLGELLANYGSVC